MAYVYWITLTLSGFLCLVCYSFTPKPDVIAIQLLIFFAGLTGVGILHVLHAKYSKESLCQSSLEIEGTHLESEDNSNKHYTTARVSPILITDSCTSLRERHQNYRSRFSRFCFSFWRVFNRFLKVVHWAMSVIFIAGAITLALSYRFTNPYV